MRALEVSSFGGPDTVLLVERAEPNPDADTRGVVIEVHAAGVAFPDLLLTRGLYQMRPEPPFVPGMEVAGVVRQAPAGSELSLGDRVAAWPRALMRCVSSSSAKRSARSCWTCAEI